MSGYVQKYLEAQQWAILEEYLELMAAVGDRDEEWQSEAAEAIQRRYGVPVANTSEATIRGNVGIIPLTGPLFRYANLFTAISGATSMERFAADFGALLEDERVDHIVIDVNSPGGSVDGTAELAALVASAQKPVTAYISHLGASAALWVASAADQVFAAPTALVGSVGVVMNARRVKDRAGVESMEIVSSQTPKKRMDPFADGVEGEKARKEIQERVDVMASVFISAVAGYRDMDPDAVAATEGAVFVGEQAQEAGFVDGIGTMEGLIQGLQDAGAASATPIYPYAAGLASTVNPEGEPTMDITRAHLEENHPDLVEAILSDGREQGRTQGATEERERILGIYGIEAPGFDSLKADLMEDPEVGRGEAALRILNAKGEREAQRAQAVKDGIKEDEADLAEVQSEVATDDNEDMEAEASAQDVLSHAKRFQEAGLTR